MANQAIPHSQVKVRVPATTANLGPGFDVLGMALQLYNEIEVTTDTSETAIEISGETDPSIPSDSSNYVVRGAHATFQLAGRRPPPLRFCVVARIPIARGLGSSAAALVGGAIAANALLDDPVDATELIFGLMNIEGHSEQLAAALFGGLVAVVPSEPLGIKHLDAPGTPVMFPLPVSDEIVATLAIPEIRLETKAARSVLPPVVPFKDAVANMAAITALSQGLCTNDPFLIRLGTRDKLHQNARSALNPPSLDVMAAARDSGAYGACWSGAGPAILAFSSSEETADIATAMVSAFRDHKVLARSITCAVDIDGCVALEIDRKDATLRT